MRFWLFLLCWGLVIVGCAPQPYYEVGRGNRVTSSAASGDDWQYGQIVNEHKDQALELILDHRFYRSDFEIERSPGKWGNVRKVVVGPGDRLSVGIRTKPGPKTVWLVSRPGSDIRTHRRNITIDANPTNARGFGWIITFDRSSRIRHQP